MSNVNHPSHYNLPGKKECIEQMREDYGDYITGIFCLTNAYKYLYRAGNKGDKQEDIDKAKWYFNYLDSISDFDERNDNNFRELYDYIKIHINEIKEEKNGSKIRCNYEAGK